MILPCQYGKPCFQSRKSTLFKLDEVLIADIIIVGDRRTDEQGAMVE